MENLKNYKDMFSFFLPEWILNYFDCRSVRKTDWLLNIRLIEKDNLPEIQILTKDQKIVSI